jgi:muramoyltetrapeptide carboxypeptidase
LLHLLDPLLPKSPPQNVTIIGFSDISLLLLHLSQHGFHCIHGPNISTLTQIKSGHQDELKALLFHDRHPEFPNLNVRNLPNPAGAVGPILPMNWSVLCSILGTRFAPNLEGKILILEDVNEAPYRMDRLLMQLAATAWFPKLSALVIGKLGGAETDSRFLRSLDAVTKTHNVPCAMGIPVGHGEELAPLRLGEIMRLAENGLTIVGALRPRTPTAVKSASASSPSLPSAPRHQHP